MHVAFCYLVNPGGLVPPPFPPKPGGRLPPGENPGGRGGGGGDGLYVGGGIIGR